MHFYSLRTALTLPSLISRQTILGIPPPGQQHGLLATAQVITSTRDQYPRTPLTSFWSTRARSGTQPVATAPTRGCGILAPHTPPSTHRNTSVLTVTPAQCHPVHMGVTMFIDGVLPRASSLPCAPPMRWCSSRTALSAPAWTRCSL